MGVAGVMLVLDRAVRVALNQTTVPLTLNTTLHGFSFLLLQIHSLVPSIELSAHSNYSLHTKRQSGSSIGMLLNASNIHHHNESLVIASIDRPPNTTVDALVWVTAYQEHDPVPAACDTHASPVLHAEMSSRVLFLNFSNAAQSFESIDSSCDQNSSWFRRELEYRLHVEFLTEDQAESFDQILASYAGRSTPGSAVQICKRTGFSEEPFFRVVAWSGYPAVYTLTIHSRYHNKRIATYAPVFTRHCPAGVSCVIPRTPIWRWFCLIPLGVLCAVVAICGHYSFTSSTFFHGSALVFLLTLAVILRTSFIAEFTAGWISVVFGLCGGLGLAMLWCILGSPFLHVCVSTLLLGLLLASYITYFTFDVCSPDPTSFAEYSLTFLLLTLSFPALLLSWPRIASILSCALSASFLFACCVSALSQASLHLTLWRTIERFAYTELHSACFSHTPLLTVDAMAQLVWLVFALIGLSTQFHLCKGRSAPFPPPPRLLNLQEQFRQSVRSIAAKLAGRSESDVRHEAEPLLHEDSSHSTDGEQGERRLSYGSIN